LIKVVTFNISTSARSTLGSNEATGEKYRWIGEDGTARSTTEDGYTVQSGRFGTRGVTLYANGEAVAVSTSTRTSYLGKDIMGSVRSSTSDNGFLEDRYEYDVLSP